MHRVEAFRQKANDFGSGPSDILRVASWHGGHEARTGSAIVENAQQDRHPNAARREPSRPFNLGTEFRQLRARTAFQIEFIGRTVPEAKEVRAAFAPLDRFDLEPFKIALPTRRQTREVIATRHA
jgi:hypothetical protein